MATISIVCHNAGTSCYLRSLERSDHLSFPHPSHTLSGQWISWIWIERWSGGERWPPTIQIFNPTFFDDNLKPRITMKETFPDQALDFLNENSGWVHLALLQICRGLIISITFNGNENGPHSSLDEDTQWRWLKLSGLLLPTAGRRRYTY